MPGGTVRVKVVLTEEAVPIFWELPTCEAVRV
jgi:hypothetical protein